MKKHLVLLTLFPLLLTSCNKKQGISFHTELQESYLRDSYEMITLYATGKEELSKPNPISFSWDDEGSFKGVLKEGNNVVKEYDLTTNKIDLYNLKLDTDYSLYINKDNIEINSFSFVTSDEAPRNLNIDGVTNCRDLGGYKISKSKRVKQDMLFRTAQYDDEDTHEKIITEKGIDTMINDLKIKTEVDLRRFETENCGTSPLGSEVTYNNIPMNSSGNVLKLNKTSLSKVFKLLGDEKNYPIAFHCAIGTDRTGLIGFLVNGLLGVSKDDLYRDYLFSNFGLISSMRTASTIDTYLEDINLCEGKDLKDRIYNYLLSCNVNENDLKNVRNILIEDVK